MQFGGGEFQYELVDGWAKLPAGWSFLDVGGLATDSQDRLYVFNRSPHPVMIFDKDGSFLGSWGEEFFNRPHGVRISKSDDVYCTDDGNHTVSKFTLQGELLMTLGSKDNPSDTGYVKQKELLASLATIKHGGPPFNRPTGVALSSSGNIYVSDGYGNARVHEFDADGRLLSSWGEPGRDIGQFRLPHNVWVDEKDRVWIPDRENSRIQIFDSQGTFITAWYDVSRPSDIYSDGNGVVYVSEIGHVDGSGPCISLFTIDGEVITRWGNDMIDHATDLFVSPHAISVDSRGDLYVGEVAMTHSGLDRGARVIQKFALVN